MESSEFPFIHVQFDGTRQIVSGSALCRLGRPVRAGSQPEGVFGEWELRADGLEARVDPLGFFSLFYSVGRNDVFVSPSPIRLIAEGVPADVDDEALAVFATIGWFLGEDTPFRAVRVLPPGGVLRWSRGSFSVERSGGAGVRPASPISREAAQDAFVDLLRESVRRHLDACDGEPVLPLSGGRDSRHILFAMLHAGRPPARCITYVYNGTPPDPDLEAAQRVAAAAGVVHEIISNDRSPVMDFWKTLILSHLCTDELYNYLPVWRYVGRRRCSIFDGIAGDVLTRNKSFSDPVARSYCAEGRWDEAVAHGLSGGFDRVTGTRYEERVGRRRRYLDLRGPARERIREALRAHAGAADPWTSFLFWTRTRREISLIPCAMLADAGGAHCPYLSEGIVELLASLPPEITADGKFHDTAIARAYPQFASLAYHDQLPSIYGQYSLTKKIFLRLQNVLASGSMDSRLLVPEVVEQLARPRRGSNPTRTVFRLQFQLIDKLTDRRFLRRVLAEASPRRSVCRL